MLQSDAIELRQQLLDVHGVGPETADSILLYAAGHPIFVADAYAGRIATRHGWIEPDADYHTLQDFFESGLDRDAKQFNEYHALIVAVGKEFCRSKPRCDECPLRSMLPESGVADLP